MSGNLADLPRKARRKLGQRSEDRAKTGWPTGPFARAPRRTGSTYERDLARRKVVAALKRVPTARLVEDCPEIALVADAYPDAYALSTASYKDLLKLRGVGPAKLRKIRGYLSTKNVYCEWKVPA